MVSEINRMIDDMIDAGTVKKIAKLQHDYYLALREAGFSSETATEIVIKTKLIGS
jgi:hypothetical protein